MDFMEFCVVVIASVTLLLFLLDLWWKPKLNLPYPKRIPVLGHLLYFVKSPHVTLTSWAETCGEIYCVQLLNKSIVIVSGYEAAHEVLLTKGKEYAGRAHRFRTDMITENGSNIVFQSMNPTWKKMRLFTQRKIKQYGEGLGRVEEIVQESAQELIEWIGEDAKKGLPVDPDDYLYLTIVNTMTALITGKKLTLQDPVFRKINKLMELLVPNMTLSRGAELDVMPWLRYFGNKTYKDLSQYVKLQSEVYQTLKIMYKNGSLNSDGLAFALFNATDSNTAGISDIVDDKVTKVVMFDVLLGGIVTSGASLYILLLVLASHPDIQQTLHEEVTKCKQKTSGPMSLTDRQSMPFTRACQLELMRYASVVPMTMEHTAMVDSEILGHKIPKDTEVYINLFGLHHSEKYWEEPWKFKPARFLDDEGQLVTSDHINRKRLLPFGTGPRVCIGQTFAMSRIFIFATSLIQKFEIRPAPNHEIVYDPRKYKLNAVLSPPRVKLLFTKRQS